MDETREMNETKDNAQEPAIYAESSIDGDAVLALAHVLRHATLAVLDCRVGSERRAVLCVRHGGGITPVAMLLDRRDWPRLTWHGQHLAGVTPEPEPSTGLYL
jgi:hypothetical protein